MPTTPFPRTPQRVQPSSRQELYALIETCSEELCDALLRVLRVSLEAAAPPPPAAQAGQDSTPTGPRP